MGVSNTSYQPQVSVGAKNSKITNLSLPLADTEASHVLQNGLRGVIIKSRVSNVQKKLAFTATESGTKYVTIKKNNTFALDLLEWQSKTLYIQAESATTVEILELYT